MLRIGQPRSNRKVIPKHSLRTYNGAREIGPSPRRMASGVQSSHWPDAMIDASDSASDIMRRQFQACHV